MARHTYLSLPLVDRCGIPNTQVLLLRGTIGLINVMAHHAGFREPAFDRAILRMGAVAWMRGHERNR